MIPIFPLLSRVPRLRNLLIPFMFFLCLGTMPAHAANISPVGIGDLMPSPSTNIPSGGTTMFETYNNMLLWELDSDLGVSDVLDGTLGAFADVCMMLIVVIGRAVVVVVQWLFALTSIPELEHAITRSIGGAATGLTETLLPAALAIGAVVAFADHKRSGGNGGLSQLAWVAVSGVVSISLLTSPGAWVSGVDTARTVGAGITMQATSAGLGDGTQSFPWQMDHAPQFTGNPRDDALRKSSDSVWRAYVAGPWCLAEFGSLEACRKFGPGLMAQGDDPEKRKEWLQDNVTQDAVGKASVKWRQGHRPAARLAVLFFCLVSLLIFAVLVLMLCFASLASLLGALMLLLTGVIFACLWVIPGKPRQWGMAWFDQLLGRTLESTVATLVLGAVLSMQTATTQMFGTYGWLPSAGISIAVGVVGIKFRRTIATIFGVSGSSSSGVGGLMMMQALTKAGGRLLKRRPSKGTPKKGKGPGGDKGGSGGPGDGSGSGSAGGTGTGTGRSGGGGQPPTPTRPRPIPPPPPPLPDQALDPAPARVPLPAGSRTGSGSTTSDHRTSPRPLPRPEPRPIPAAAGSGTARTPLSADTSTSRPDAGTGDRPAPIAEHHRPELPPARTAPSAVEPTPARDDDGPEYGFRQAPPPPLPGEPRVVRGEVISRTPPVVADRPPRRRGTTTPPPARRVAPAARTQVPTPRATRRG
ncbi:hypothetical protein ACFVUY_38250 [Kitasatospora sp. NPDC058063]|uniref:hypothetical protein n=1 Tax=unclassified Kitasatospora TaxID=2633591 RepID=UPI0036DBCD42